MRDIIKYPIELTKFINILNIANYYDDVLDSNSLENRFLIKHSFNIGPHIYMDLLIMKTTNENYLYFLDKRTFPTTHYVFKFFGSFEDYLKIKRLNCKRSDSMSCVDDYYIQSECFYNFMGFTHNKKEIFGKKYNLK